MNISELSKDAKEALIAAQDIALSKRHTEVMPEHLLLAVLRKRSGPVESLLSYLDKNMVLLQSIVEMDMEGFPKSEMAKLKLPMSPLIEDVISAADLERDNFKSPKIGCEHIFLALLDSGSSISPELIAKMEISKGELYRALGEMPEDIQPSVGVSDELITVAGTGNYCRDLTALAGAGKLDPAIGYDDKMIEILQILVRRHRSNPILVGPDGVGKSALLRGFAQRMVDGNLLGEMKAKRLLQLDIDEITSGIKYRGELEERFRTVLENVKESSRSAILAIDDIQELLTISPTGGPPEMVGPLKAFLGRGEVTVIASTNEEDFTRHFSLDKALASLFQRISIQPPTLEQALEIIEGIKKRYEEHHDLKIDQEAISDSVRMSKRYLGGRILPDVAIDVLDEAASLFRLVSENLKSKLQKTIGKIEGGDGKDASDNLSELKDIFENCSYRPEIKSLSITLPDEPKPDFDLAAPAKKLMEALNSIEKKVTSDDVARTVSRWTGIPLAKMREDEAQKVLHMEEYLTKRVVGQDEAVRIISEAVRKARAGLKRPNRPIGAFIFLGPTGTGKTELAKAIAEFLFDDEKNIVRLDMSEYMEKHNVAKLIGAPPGYVGYEEGGILTESVKRQPYSVVLFDEIEKAHLDIFNVLLQLLDDGRLTDGKNRTIDFSNTIVIMTSNYAGMEIVEKDRKNESFTPEELRELMLRKFKPEILNRIQEVIVFHTLSKESLKVIVDIQINEVRKLLSDKNIGLQLTQEAVDKLSEEGYDFEMGARPLQRLIEKEILSRLSVKIITGEVKPGDRIEIGVSEGSFKIDVLQE
ncbi:MAG: ATP-dependent Clp protease ATP-binding subunit [Candidatus Zixiibacteriota bacterium]|nr:MAG: ATP-dependent Clp protease ATP-binding subunit [candidate division Zixibacteria bacterium]